MGTLGLRSSFFTTTYNATIVKMCYNIIMSDNIRIVKRSFDYIFNYAKSMSALKGFYLLNGSNPIYTMLIINTFKFIIEHPEKYDVQMSEIYGYRNTPFKKILKFIEVKSDLRTILLTSLDVNKLNQDEIKFINSTLRYAIKPL